MSNFPKSIRLESNSQGRDWIIPDIHGCDLTLGRLLKKIDLKKSDRLFLLGDLVNKGPRSFQVLDRLMAMEKDDFQVFKVLGNHDLIWMELLSGEINHRHRKIIDQGELKWDSWKSFEYFSFLEQSYYFIEIEEYFLVHAGFDFNAKDPFEAYKEMTSIRAFVPDDHYLKGRKIIHGHIAHSLDQITSAIELGLQKIPLDNGCVYLRTREGMGKLLALNLNSLELTYETNIDVS